MSPVRHPEPVASTGVVLAGGAGRRIGGDKALTLVGGRPLLEAPVRALRRVCTRVAIVARGDTALPPLTPEPLLWLEDDGPRHPVNGIVHALRRAAGEPVLVCAGDLALVDPPTLRVLLIAAALAPEAPAVLPRAGGHLQVLCGLYRPAALAGLEHADPAARLTDLVSALGPAIVPFADATAFFNVNTPADVQQAQALLAARDR